MPYRNLGQTEANLSAAGLESLVGWLLSGGDTPGDFIGERSVPFLTEKMAKRAQRLLYEWLWFHPEIKARASIGLMGTTLTVRFRPWSERRGRRGMK